VSKHAEKHGGMRDVCSIVAIVPGSISIYRCTYNWTVCGELCVGMRCRMVTRQAMFGVRYDGC
jgi:hypothetical protein